MFVADETKQQQKVETDAEEGREIQSPSPAKPKYYRPLDATDLDQLQNVYPKIVSEICELISQLKHSKIEWSKFKSEEKRIMVMLCSVKQLIKVKNSIFLLHGLQPSLFSLFFGLLPFADRWVLTFLPNFHYLLLQMAKEFALTHDHFFHNCEIFQSGFSDKQKSNVGTTAPLSFSSSVSGKYFAKILDSLAELFRFFNILQNHAQATLIDWLSKISNLVVEQFKVVSELREMFALRSSLLLVPFFSLYSIKSFEMRKSLVKCLYRIHVFNVLLSDEPSCKILSHQFIAKLRECAEHLEVEQFRTLWNRIPITYLIRISEISTIKCLSFLEIAKRTQKLLGKMCMEPNEFRFVTDFLFGRKRISMLQDNCSPQNWLFISGQYLFESLSCTANDESQKASTTFNENAKQNNRIGDSASLLQKWLFIVGQFAHYCAVNRMKTPIGKTPLETFTKFEAQLRALASSSTSQLIASRSKNLASNEKGIISYSNSNDEDHLSMNQSSGNCGKEQRNLYPEEEWFRVRMLLHCIDMVEKMMCYAVRGSMLKIYDELPLNARQFFSVNFKTCMDWLFRTALPLMSTAYANGHYAQIVRFGGFLFAELERKHPSNASNDTKIRLDPSIQFAITWVIRALVRLGAPQAIRGVQRFSETMFGPAVDFSWCHYAELLASARVEEALDGCLNFLNCAKQSKENVPKVHDHVLNAIDELALMAAGILRLPQAETKIREAIIDREEVKDDESGESGAKMTALFSLQSWESVLKLSSWDQLANSAPYTSPTQLTTETKNESWALNNRLLETEAKIMRIFEIRQKNSIGRQNTGEILFSQQDELSDLAQFLLCGGHENSDGLAHSKLAILHAICTGIQHLNVPNQQYHVQPAQIQQHFPPKGQQSAKQMMRSPPKYSVSTPILLEVDFADLLHNCNSNALHRLEIGQMYCGWMHRLYGAQKEHSFVLKRMHGQIAQLAQKLGNPNLANTHFRLSVQNGGTQNSWPIDDLYGNQMRRQLDILPEYQLPMGISNLYIQQQTQPQFQSIPPGFESLLGNQPFQTEDAHNHFTVNNISFTAPATPQATKSLLSEDFDGDSLRLLPNELAIMQQFGIDISSPQGRHFEELIGSCSTFEEFRSQIVEHFPLTDVSMNSTAILMVLDQSNFTQFWLSIKHRQYRLYELALNSHLRFLENLSSEKSYVQTAEVILRFLKMLSRQPEWFQRIVTFPDDKTATSAGNNSGKKLAWMDRIPVNVWTGMIPQLFACLNHSNSIVVDAIHMLLEQIGQNLPHVVCYPAIVIAGAADEKANTMPLLSEFSKENSERLIVSSNACECLIDSLAAKFPALVRDTTEFCRSLQRIAQLNEEKWLYTLTQFDHRIGRLIRSSMGLSDASVLPDLPNGRSSPPTDGRLREYMEQVLKSLKYLEEMTCKESGESENERQFKLLFGEQIQSSLVIMEQNILNDPRKAWEPFRKLISMLNKQALKRTSLCLNLSKISTHLGDLSATSVPVPGQELCSFNQAVTVHKMDKIAFVLPTKTRPKKLSLIGSDGKSYTFLFKGQENLYMDTRLMQLLRMCNEIFDDTKNHRPMDMNPSYHCVTYAVTPLGRRSGLIKWVDGAIPLFQIYRRWRIRHLQFNAENDESKQQKLGSIGKTIPTKQQRQSAHLKKGVGKESGETADNASIGGKKKEGDKEPEPERPMEQFYNKLKAVFAANRVPKECLNDRKRWPNEVLKIVLKELGDETPKDILAKELWIYAATSDDWWMNTQNFARTAAVSSMLGALIGLGDRHLDNVLVDLHSGQIVHVDYNICFGKGRTLRVPETVPFRLTENIRTALGPTKCEGIFRLSSERVIEMLRADKHLLLQLMDTLKSDPMLDFTFLQSNSELRNKSRQQLVDFLVYGIGRKLSGFELKRRRNISSRKSPGLLNLEGEASKECPGKEPSSAATDWEEIGTANVAEQVDLLVQEATDWDNLALMYEGWTAWV